MSCHNLSFSRFVKKIFEWQKMFVERPKPFEFLSFVTFWGMGLHILSLWVVTFWVFEFCHIRSFTTLLVLEFCHILIFRVWSHWDLFSFVQFLFLSHFFCWVLSHLEFESFVTFEDFFTFVILKKKFSFGSNNIFI